MHQTAANTSQGESKVEKGWIEAERQWNIGIKGSPANQLEFPVRTEFYILTCLEGGPRLGVGPYKKEPSIFLKI